MIIHFFSQCQVASVRVELNTLREELDSAINKQEFTKAAEIKEKVQELETTKSSLLEEMEPRSQETRVEKVTFCLLFLLL